MVKCGVLFEVRTEFLNILEELRLGRVKSNIMIDTDKLKAKLYSDIAE
jgi:hypothetical protein